MNCIYIINNNYNHENVQWIYIWKSIFFIFLCGTFKELVFISDTDKYMVEVGSSWHSALQKGIIVNTLWPACTRWWWGVHRHHWIGGGGIQSIGGVKAPLHPDTTPTRWLKTKMCCQKSQHVRNTVSRDLLCRGESLWLLKICHFSNASLWKSLNLGKQPDEKGQKNCTYSIIWRKNTAMRSQIFWDHRDHKIISLETLE